MTAREVMQMLGEAYHLAKREQQLRRMRADLMLLATHTTASWSSMPKGGTTRSKVEEYASKAADVASEIDELRLDILDRQREAERLIQRLQDPELQTILHDYHLERKSLQQIADEMHYDVRTIYNKRMRAYELIAQTFPTISDLDNLN